MQNISKNLWFSVFNIVVTTVVTLFSIKFLLAGLGPVKFGLFSIITILNSLSSLLSFGLNYTLLHYLPKQGKTNESNLDIIVVLIISFAISIFIALVLYLFAPQISSLIKVPLAYRPELMVFIKYIAGTIIFILPIQILLAVFDAEHKNFVSNIMQALFTILYWGLLAIISLHSSNLEDYGKALVMLYPCWYLILGVVFFKIWGSLSVTRFGSNFFRVVRKHGKTGITYFLTNLVGYFNEPVSKLLVSRYIGLDVVAFFDIAMRVKNQVWGLFSKITYPLLPLFSSMKEKERIKSLIVTLTGVIFILASGISLYLITEGDYLVNLWLHNDSPVVANFIKISIAAYLMFSAVVFPVYYYFVAENKANYLSIIQLVGSLFNIIFFFAFKGKFQTYAIMVSLLASLFLAAIVCFFLYYRYTGGFSILERKKMKAALVLSTPLLLLAILCLLLKNKIDTTHKDAFFIVSSALFLFLGIFMAKRKLFINNFLASEFFISNKWVNKFFLKT